MPHPKTPEPLALYIISLLQVFCLTPSDKQNQRLQVPVWYILIGYFGGLSIYHNDTWTLWDKDSDFQVPKGSTLYSYFKAYIGRGEDLGFGTLEGFPKVVGFGDERIWIRAWGIGIRVYGHF